MSTNASSIKRKGFPNMIETLKSTSKFRMTKSDRNIKDATFTNTSDKIPTDFFIVQYAINTLIEVGFSDLNPNYL